MTFTSDVCVCAETKVGKKKQKLRYDQLELETRKQIKKTTSDQVQQQRQIIN